MFSICAQKFELKYVINVTHFFLPRLSAACSRKITLCVNKWSVSFAKCALFHQNGVYRAVQECGRCKVLLIRPLGSDYHPERMKQGDNYTVLHFYKKKVCTCPVALPIALNKPA